MPQTTTSVHRVRFGLLVLCASLVCLAPAVAADKPRKAKPAAGQPAKKHGKPKFEKPASGESTAEREKRWLRECKGRPNAGACLGFAS